MWNILAMDIRHWISAFSPPLAKIFFIIGTYLLTRFISLCWDGIVWIVLSRSSEKHQRTPNVHTATDTFCSNVAVIIESESYIWTCLLLLNVSLYCSMCYGVIIYGYKSSHSNLIHWKPLPTMYGGRRKMTRTHYFVCICSSFLNDIYIKQGFVANTCWRRFSTKWMLSSVETKTLIPVRSHYKGCMMNLPPSFIILYVSNSPWLNGLVTRVTVVFLLI